MDIGKKVANICYFFVNIIHILQETCYNDII